MKIISTLLKIVATILMIIFIFIFPLTLLGRGIARMIFSPDGLVQDFAESLLDANVFASMAEELVVEIENDNSVSSSEEQYIYQMMTNISHEDWVEIINIVAPPELMKSTTDELFSGVFEWINGPQPYPDISIDLRDWKFNLERSSIPIIEIVLGALPNCSPTEIGSFSAGELIPFCKLPEPHYSNLIDTTSSDISNLLSDMPNGYQINETTLSEGPGGGERIPTAKGALQRARNLLRYSWLLFLGMFLIAIPLGARSIPDSFKWAGIPLLITGIFTSIFALGIISLGGVLLSGFTTNIVSELPASLAAPVNVVFSSVITSLGNPLIVQGIFISVIGGVAFVIAIAWSRLQTRNVEVAGLETIQMSQQQSETPEDDGNPSGMFG